MSTKDKVTVKIEQAHDCGQIIEHTWHVDEADFTVKEDWPSLFKAPSQDGPFHIPESPKRRLTFNGICSKLEIKGIEWKDTTFVCQKCGADMLFPNREEQAS